MNYRFYRGGDWPRLASLLRCIGMGGLVVTLATGCQSGGDTNKSQSPPSPTPATSVTRPELRARPPILSKRDRMQVNNFEVMRTAPEQLPKALRLIARRSAHEMDWTHAQRLRVPAGHGASWAVPGHEAICILARGADASVGETCSSIDYAALHGVATISITESSALGKADRIVDGIVPGKSKWVRVETNHEIKVQRVHRGIFWLHDSDPMPPDQIILLGNGYSP